MVTVKVELLLSSGKRPFFVPSEKPQRGTRAKMQGEHGIVTGSSIRLTDIIMAKSIDVYDRVLR